MLIGNVYNIIAYSMIHNCLNILGRRALRSSIIEQVNLICQEVKSNISGYFEMIGKRINLVLYTRVVI